MCIRDSLDSGSVDGHVVPHGYVVSYLYGRFLVQGVEHASIPVSYTHLDVYKRQVQRQVAEAGHQHADEKKT